MIRPRVPQAVLVACAVMIAGAWACGGPEPCTSSAACPGETTCRPDGTCAPLERPRGRVGRARWLAAGQWGVTRDDRPGSVAPATDQVWLGGDVDATLHLEFGPLPEGGRLEQALLRLTPHESWSGPSEGRRLVVDRTEAFEGAGLTRRTVPRRVEVVVAERTVAAGGPRPILLDLTDAVRRARRMGLGTLHVAVRQADPDGTPWRLASPRALDRRARPRLELHLR